MNEENEAEEGAFQARSPRKSKPTSPEERRAFRAIAAQHAPKASDGPRSHQEALEPRSTIELLPQACLRLLDDLDEQQALNAELHKGVCAGYAELLGRARRMEDALGEVKTFAKAIAVVHESAAVREKALAVEHRIASVLA